MKKPETKEEWESWFHNALPIIVECRDAITNIPMTAVRLNKVSPSLDRRIENLIEPWALTEEQAKNHPNPL